jgi:hypothetical protein
MAVARSGNAGAGGVKRLKKTGFGTKQKKVETYRNTGGVQDENPVHKNGRCSSKPQRPFQPVKAPTVQISPSSAPS